MRVLNHFAKVYPILFEKYFKDMSNPTHINPQIKERQDQLKKHESQKDGF